MTDHPEGVFSLNGHTDKIELIPIGFNNQSVVHFSLVEMLLILMPTACFPVKLNSFWSKP